MKETRMKTKPTPFVKPDIQFINELLDKLETGAVRIPKFQRPYIWKPKSMLSLFDSISRGYPLGSILFWDTDIEILSSDSIGPKSIPKKGENATFILDGQQRITTLLGALRYDEDYDDEKDSWRWRIYYDLKSDEFVHAKNGPESSYFPIWKLLRTMDFLEEARRIQNQCDDADELIKKAEHLAETLRSYRLSIIYIIGGDLNQAVEIFSRLNTRGQEMSIDQMVSALTYKEGENAINLAEEINKISEELSAFHFGGINRIIILRSIVAAAGRDIHKSEWEEIAKKLDDNLTDAVVVAKESLIQSADYLFNEIGVKGDRFLPYSNQLLFLSHFFTHCSTPTDEQLKKITIWFWSTSLTGWFSGANSTQINAGLKAMKDLAQGMHKTFNLIYQDVLASPLPSNFDMRSARIRAHLLLIAKTQPTDISTGRAVNIESLLENDPEYTLPHIFKKAKDKTLISDPANRLLSTHIRGKKLRDALLDDIAPSDLNSQFIEGESFEALKSEDADKFIKARRELIIQKEKEVIENLGLKLDKGPSSEVLDADG